MSAKQIRSLSDLAIHGAEPGFSSPIHVGQPRMAPKARFYEYVDGIFERDWYTNDGMLVRQLEQEISDYQGVKHCVAMTNGTLALEIAIRALELSGEVIVPSFTFIATAHALSWQGIQPVFADINPATHCLDPHAVEALITERTTGIIGVHLWGNICETEALADIARRNQISVMYDAAHAFGCEIAGQRVGSFGACEILSFHATKVFSTFEGGAILTNDDELAEKARLMRNFGFSGLDNVIYPGTNGKMSEVSAAMGLTNLQQADQVIEENRIKHQQYKEMFDQIAGVQFMAYAQPSRNNCQYAVAELSEDFPVSRDELVDIFHKENIRVRRYFWPGCHNMAPYNQTDNNRISDLEVTEQVARKILVFPTGDAVNNEVINFIGQVLEVVGREA